MTLQNQNQSNLNYSNKLNEIANLVKQSGLTPEQYLNKIMSSGQFSQSDLSKAKQLANLAFNKRR